MRVFCGSIRNSSRKTKNRNLRIFFYMRIYLKMRMYKNSSREGVGRVIFVGMKENAQTFFYKKILVMFVLYQRIINNL